MGISYFYESDIGLLRLKMADESDFLKQPDICGWIVVTLICKEDIQYGDFFKG